MGSELSTSSPAWLKAGEEVERSEHVVGAEAFTGFPCIRFAPRRKDRQGPGDVIVFSAGLMRSMAAPQGRSSITGNRRPPIRPFEGKDGQCFLMREPSPSSHFHHFYPSVCTSYAAVCSPYALFAREQEANEE